MSLGSLVGHGATRISGNTKMARLGSVANDWMTIVRISA